MAQQGTLLERLKVESLSKRIAVVIVRREQTFNINNEKQDNNNKPKFC